MSRTKSSLAAAAIVVSVAASCGSSGSVGVSASKAQSESEIEYYQPSEAPEVAGSARELLEASQLVVVGTASEPRTVFKGEQPGDTNFATYAQTFTVSEVLRGSAGDKIELVATGPDLTAEKPADAFREGTLVLTPIGLGLQPGTEYVIFLSNMTISEQWLADEKDLTAPAYTLVGATSGVFELREGRTVSVAQIPVLEPTSGLDIDGEALDAIERNQLKASTIEELAGLSTDDLSSQLNSVPFAGTAPPGSNEG